MTEGNVLDEHALDLNTPASSNIFDNLSNGLCNLLTTLNDILENARTKNMAQSGLRTLNKRLANIGDTKSGNMRSDNVVVDDRGQAQSNIVLRHTDLLRDFCNLNLHVDGDEILAERVDADKTWVNGLVELAKLGDKTDVALLDTLERVGADDATRDGATGSYAGPESIGYGGGQYLLHLTDDDRKSKCTHSAVPALGVGIGSNDSGIAALKILFLGRLNGHPALRLEADVCGIVLWSFG